MILTEAIVELKVYILLDMLFINNFILYYNIYIS